MRPTGFVLSATGCLIDYFVYLGAFLTTAGVVLELAESIFDTALMIATQTILLVTFLVIVPIAVESLSRGRSLGRLIVGARIVRDDGGAIGVRHALIRALIGIVEIVMTFGGLAAIVGLLSPKSKRLGDIVAGTFSQRERTAAPPAVEFAVPAELVAWAAVADVARLPDPVARRVAHFIRGSAGMNPASRAQLAHALATEVAVHVHPVPAVSPEQFLLAVAAMRRSRDATALARQRAQWDALAPVLQATPRGFPDRG
ncbi:MAG: RDD family protein [Microbacterium sp.]|uniref:RDD family protein n=1 Tax=Microbacterium sp. TaxID=51671 RepID=UPI003A8A905D